MFFFFDASLNAVIHLSLFRENVKRMPAVGRIAVKDLNDW